MFNKDIDVVSFFSKLFVVGECFEKYWVVVSKIFYFHPY